MLISDFNTDDDRARFAAMPEGVAKRAVARHYETELLKRLGYLHGEPAGPTAGWKLFPEDMAAPKVVPSATSAVRRSFSGGK